MAYQEDCGHCTQDNGWGVEDADSGACKHHRDDYKIEKNVTKKKKYIELISTKPITFREASEAIGVSEVTIWRWRQKDEEFDKKVKEIKEGVQQHMRRQVIEDAVFTQIANGDAPAGVTIFWLKNVLGWTDDHRIQHTGDGGGPIQKANINISVDDIKEAIQEGNINPSKLGKVTRRMLSSGNPYQDSN